MDFKIYRLLNKETGLFNSGGNNWTKRGKAWTQKNHIKTALTNHAQHILVTTLEKECANRFQAETGLDSERNYWHSARQKYYEMPEYLLSNDKTRREELYSYLPDNWVIIEITPTGAQELCKAKEFWKI